MGGIVPPALHLVTDRRLRPTDLCAAVAAAVAHGVDAVHLREPDLAAADLYDLARALRAVTRGRALLIVHDRVDVALAAEADGAQLGERGLPVEAARRIAGSRLLLGRSVHSAEGAARAASDGADFVLIGTIFASASHPNQVPAGPELVRAARALCPLPLIAIGGIDAANAPLALAAGADGVAVIRALLSARDVAAAAARLKQALRGSRQETQPCGSS